MMNGFIDMKEIDPRSMFLKDLSEIETFTAYYQMKDMKLMNLVGTD